MQGFVCYGKNNKKTKHFVLPKTEENVFCVHEKWLSTDTGPLRVKSYETHSLEPEPLESLQFPALIYYQTLYYIDI